MGSLAASAGSIQRGDARGLIGRVTAGPASVDVGDALYAATVCRRVEVGIQHATAAGPLQLEARPLSHLEAGLTETLAEFADREAEEIAAGALGSRLRSGAGLLHRDRGPRGAGGKGQGQSGSGEETHARCLGAGGWTGKRPAATRRAFPTTQQDLP